MQIFDNIILTILQYQNLKEMVLLCSILIKSKNK